MKFGRLLAFVAIGVAMSHCTQRERRPFNVILITLDTTRADHLGCYGSSANATPSIDRLARQGVRFA
jgi:arylsulfatase A-like enzyme